MLAQVSYVPVGLGRTRLADVLFEHGQPVDDFFQRLMHRRQGFLCAAFGLIALVAQVGKILLDMFGARRRHSGESLHFGKGFLQNVASRLTRRRFGDIARRLAGGFMGLFETLRQILDGEAKIDARRRLSALIETLRDLCDLPLQRFQRARFGLRLQGGVEFFGQGAQQRLKRGFFRLASLASTAIEAGGEFVEPGFNAAPTLGALRPAGFTRAGFAGLARDLLQPFGKMGDLLFDAGQRGHPLGRGGEHGANFVGLGAGFQKARAIGAAGLPQIIDLGANILQLARQIFELRAFSHFGHGAAYVLGEIFDRGQHGFAHAVIARRLNAIGQIAHGAFQRRQMRARRDIFKHAAHRRDLLAQSFDFGRGRARFARFSSADLSFTRHGVSGAFDAIGQIAHRAFQPGDGAARRDVDQSPAHGGNVVAQPFEIADAGGGGRGQGGLDPRGQIAHGLFHAGWRRAAGHFAPHVFETVRQGVDAELQTVDPLVVARRGGMRRGAFEPFGQCLEFCVKPGVEPLLLRFLTPRFGLCRPRSNFACRRLEFSCLRLAVKVALARGDFGYGAGEAGLLAVTRRGFRPSRLALQRFHHRVHASFEPGQLLAAGGRRTRFRLFDPGQNIGKLPVELAQGGIISRLLGAARHGLDAVFQPAQGAAQRMVIRCEGFSGQLRLDVDEPVIDRRNHAAQRFDALAPLQFMLDFGKTGVDLRQGVGAASLGLFDQVRDAGDGARRAGLAAAGLFLKFRHGLFEQAFGVEKRRARRFLRDRRALPDRRLRDGPQAFDKMTRDGTRRRRARGLPGELQGRFFGKLLPPFRAAALLRG